MILTLFFTKLIALKLLVPTNFKTVPPGLATYGIWPGGCNLKINTMTPIESVQHSKPLWDDQRPGFYGKLFYEEPERTEKIPIIVGSSLSTVTAVLHSKGIWAKLFHQDVLSFRHLKPTEWNLILPIFPGWTHLFPSWKMQQSKLCILNWKLYKKYMKTRLWHNFFYKKWTKKEWANYLFNN